MREGKGNGGGGLVKALIAAGLAVTFIFPLLLVSLLGADEKKTAVNSCTAVEVSAGGDNVATAVKFLTGHGLSLPQAAGLIGNLQMESTIALNPNAKNSLGYTGIAQWDPRSRWPRLVDFATDHHGDRFDLAIQLRYLAWEIGLTSEWSGHASPYTSVLKDLKAASTTASAAQVIFADYEAPGDGSLPMRQQYAAAVAKKYSSSTSTGDTPTAQVVADKTTTSDSTSSSGIRLPVVGRAVVTSNFGMRVNPGDDFKGQYMLHDGIDLAEQPTPSTVVSASAGTVKKVFTDSIGTNIVFVDAGNGVQLGYFHLDRFAAGLKAGMSVKPGTPLGKEGSTGNVSGPHLHFQVHVNGTATDPRPWMAKHGVKIPQVGGTVTGGPAGQGATGGGSGDADGCGGDGSSTPTSSTVSALQATTLKYAWPRTYPDNHLEQTTGYTAAITAAHAAGRYTGYVSNPVPADRPEGDDCGAFVTTLMHDSGWDATYNHGATLSKGAGNTSVQMAWLEKHWRRLGSSSQVKFKDLKPGDIGISASGGFHHIWVYVGTFNGFAGPWAEASQIYGESQGFAPMARSTTTVLYADKPTAVYFRKK